MPSSTGLGACLSIFQLKSQTSTDRKEMIASASRELVRPILGSAKEQGRRIPPALAKSVHTLSRRSALRLSVAMAASPIIDAFVKGDPSKGARGDCPFSHRALLTLAEKDAPYKEEYIDFDHKPQWLFDINPKGTVPIIHDLEADKWVPGSDDIVDYAEDKFPEPHLGKHDAPPHVGQSLFPSFIAALKAKPGTDEEFKKQGVLVQSLEEIDNHLRDAGTPYLGGERPNARDLELAPKVYHVTVAMKEYKNWEVPEQLKHMQEWFGRMQSRDSWKRTYYEPEKVIAGWRKHIESS